MYLLTFSLTQQLLCDKIYSQTGRSFFCVKKSHSKEAEVLSKGARVQIILGCMECKQRNYTTTKDKRKQPDRVEMKKHCRFCDKHTVHRETK